MLGKTLKNRSKTLSTLAIGVVVGGAVAGGGFAVADSSAPRTDRQITNMTDEVSKIKAYYGDTVDANGEHWASPDSNYAAQVRSIENQAHKYLESKIRHDRSGKKAIVLDVDDTSLSTYNYELETTFVYNPAGNAKYIATKTMPAVFGMNTLASWAKQQGYEVFYVTGRPETQRAATTANLAAVGFPATEDPSHMFLKNTATPPPYLPCGATCTVIQYKSGTRAHIESLGYQIVANFGDQYSDLSGGHAERTFKIPNPMYYLP
ncbi:HAD family acid phosphatase [Kitasatospora sp. GP82]|uniref:HAD family acid phosphatase n=1 Tax=Kitasatospora sp. GP82 TaxID=3035089 RepID=UPI0024771C92|nr:HAD family acid phosphatase [Kitasatospora sp. GP82]MDH6126348.1 putative secreted acid phosphatase [Kitasatospora sp. GP82]